jgi:hypothetical protein
VIEVLRGTAQLAPADEGKLNISKLRAAADAATKGYDPATNPWSKVDRVLAEIVHAELLQLQTVAPWLLNDPVFWEWLALDPFRSYTLKRWCGGEDWLDDQEDNVPKGLARAVLASGRVKSHARHAVRRLYIYADCSYVATGSYGDVATILDADQDIPGAVFERKLGLSPQMALELIRTALSFQPTKKSAGTKALSARKKTREFLKQVNLLLSTVAVEFLDSKAMSKVFSDIARDIS